MVFVELPSAAKVFTVKSPSDVPAHADKFVRNYFRDFLNPQVFPLALPLLLVWRVQKNFRPNAAAMVCEILAYLIQHPKAEDTVEGIAEWWILHQRIMQALTLVRNALAELIARDFVSAKTVNGRTLYRLNKKKKSAVRAFLQQKGVTDV